MQIQTHNDDGANIVTARVANVDRGVWWFEITGSVYSKSAQFGGGASNKREATRLAKAELRDMLTNAAATCDMLANRYLAGSPGRAKFEEKAAFYRKQITA